MTDRSSPQFHISIYREGIPFPIRVGVDVDVNILAFAFEDCEASQKLAFEVDNFDLSQFDSPTFVAGDLLEFSYGYADSMSPAQQAVVTKSFGGHRTKKHRTVSTKVSHGAAEGGVRLKIEALGKEQLFNKERITRSFLNVRRCDVATQIAKEQGYTGANVTVDSTGVGQPVILQSRMTNYEFLRQLAHKDGVELYIDSAGFHYHARKFGATPVAKLTYYADATGADPGTIVSFTLETDTSAKPGAVVAVGRDPLKKSAISASGDNASTAGRAVLAPVLAIIGELVNPQTGAITPDATLHTRVASATVVASTATSQADAQHQANGAYVKTQGAAVKVKAHCVGDPLIRAKQVVVLAGIGAMHNGAYYVTSAKHSITTSGYTMDLEMRRDGVNSGKGATKPPTASGAQNKGTPTGSGGGMTPYEIVDEKTGATRVGWK